MPLLISGPPGAPLTDAVLERFRSTPNSIYIVPTATMADHVRNSLVRGGVAIRPQSVQTLAGFLDAWSPLAATPPAVLHLAMERAIERLGPARFGEVSAFPGLIRALTGLFSEVSGKRLPPDVGGLFEEVERDLALRNFASRQARVAAAAERIRKGAGALPAHGFPGHVFFDGFFKFSVRELELLAALAGRTDVTVALPEWAGAERASTRLLAAGFETLRLEPKPTAVRTTVLRAQNIERECEEVARRILEEAERGREFRDVAIVLRSRDPYGPLMETTLARFGIPFRSYFIDPLASHLHVQFLSQICRAALAGWDQETLLRGLRMPASGLGGTAAGDELDFRIRERLPARGWPQTADLNPHDRAEAGEWAARLKSLQKWAPPLAVEDRASHERVQAWRSLGAARAGWDNAMESAAETLKDAGPMTLAAFWKHARMVLELEPLRVPDARRNVVHLLDAYEARQWSLPIVFICGLTERHFPQYHREDPIVGDAALRAAGLDTAADREREEKFLFELARTRATLETVISYPRYDEAGQNTLPSFFLQGMSAADCEERVRPASKQEVLIPHPAPIQDEALLARLAGQHTALSATAVESYLQCPFQFFTRKTLRLVERPKAPRDRLDVLVQGGILHEALAEWMRRPLLDSAALNDAFDAACREKRVPHTYRTEAIRLELLRHFESFIRDTQLQLNWTSRVEESFEFLLRDRLRLRGRVDRMDVDGSGRALVIDYKYSSAQNTKKRVKESVAGNQVQAGVYLLAAERHFGLQPAGMFFCATKKGVSWEGWHCGVEGLEELGERRTPEGIAELASDAESAVLRVHDEIVHGVVAPRPSDESKCGWCECSDICRVESIEQAREATA